METRKPLTPEEKKWLAASTDPKKLRRSLKMQYALAVLSALLLAAGLCCCFILQSLPNFLAVLVGVSAAQLLAQFFNIYVTRNLLGERDRLNQEENSK